MFDHILAALLLAALPARALWKSRPGHVKPPMAVRYRTTIVMIGALLTLLAVSWYINGRALSALGLAVPTTTIALLGIGASVVILVLLTAALKRNGGLGKAKASEELPTTQAEGRLFLLLSVAVGLGWEVLYRGFLIFYLDPYVGLPGSIAVAALAYGVAHGFEDWKRFLGSIGAAAVFTIAYVAIGNLWPLIVLHTGLPLLMPILPKSSAEAD